MKHLTFKVLMITKLLRFKILTSVLSVRKSKASKSEKICFIIIIVDATNGLERISIISQNSLQHTIQESALDFNHQKTPYRELMNQYKKIENRCLQTKR